MTPRRCPSSLFHALLLFCGVLTTVAAPREPWTTSRIHGSPEPPHPFQVQRIYTNITFVNPLDAGTIPGTRRLVVVEQRGKLWTLENETAVEADLFADLKEFNKEIVESYGVTFHPKFAENKFVFKTGVVGG